MTANRTCALRLAAGCLVVFPVNAKTRKPVFRAWQKRSSRDRAIVTEWWNRYPYAMPALDLNKCDLVVFDGDRHGGADGVAALNALLRQQPDLDLSAVPMTHTPRDGLHVYFRQVQPALDNRRGRLPDAVDVKGFGGFVLAPGGSPPHLTRCYRLRKSARQRRSE